MNFDEAKKEIDEALDLIDYEYDYNLVTDLGDVIELLEKLRQEYAPTVEMTKEQHDLIFDARYNDRDKLYEIMGTDDGYYFHAEYWGNLEPHDVAQAYLHPETIVVTDSE